MTKLEEIEGIGPAYAAKLQGAGIGSIAELLSKGATPAGRKTLAAASEIDDSRILEWVNRADLMRIKGVGSEYSDLLEAAGVDTVPELAQRNPENLLAKMTEVNAAKKLVRRVPTLAETQAWVAEAKTLERVVIY